MLGNGRILSRSANVEVSGGLSGVQDRLQVPARLAQLVRRQLAIPLNKPEDISRARYAKGGGGPDGNALPRSGEHGASTAAFLRLQLRRPISGTVPSPRRRRRTLPSPTRPRSCTARRELPSASSLRARMASRSSVHSRRSSPSQRFLRQLLRDGGRAAARGVVLQRVVSAIRVLFPSMPSCR